MTIASEIQAFRRHLRTIERVVAEHLKAQTRCCGVTLAQCHTLIELGEAGGINLAGLSERMGLDVSTVSRTVDALVREGLIARTIDPANRRAVVIALTCRGKEQLGRIHRSCNAFYGRMLRTIPACKRPALLEGIRLVADVFTAEAASGRNAASGTIPTRRSRA